MLRYRAQLRAHAGDHAGLKRTRRGQDREQLGGQRQRSVDRDGDVQQQHHRIVVALIERDPRDGSLLTRDQLREKRRLAIPRRCEDPDHRRCARASQPVQKRTPHDGTRTHRRRDQLRFDHPGRRRPIAAGDGLRRSESQGLVVTHEFQPSPTPAPAGGQRRASSEVDRRPLSSTGPACRRDSADCPARSVHSPDTSLIEF